MAGLLGGGVFKGSDGQSPPMWLALIGLVFAAAGGFMIYTAKKRRSVLEKNGASNIDAFKKNTDEQVPTTMSNAIDAAMPTPPVTTPNPTPVSPAPTVPAGVVPPVTPPVFTPTAPPAPPASSNPAPTPPSVNSTPATPPPAPTPSVDNNPTQTAPKDQQQP